MMTPHAHPTSIVSESRLRVRYAETDQMKVVYHSNYIIWFEVGRVEFLRQLGFAYRDKLTINSAVRGTARVVANAGTAVDADYQGIITLRGALGSIPRTRSILASCSTRSSCSLDCCEVALR